MSNADKPVQGVEIQSGMLFYGSESALDELLDKKVHELSHTMRQLEPNLKNRVFGAIRDHNATHKGRRRRPVRHRGL